MSDNRTNEPSHNRITIRAFRDGVVSIIHEDQVLGLACTLDELKRAVTTYEARAGLVAAGVAPQPVIDEAALAEVIGKVTDLWDEPLDEVHDIPQIARAVAAWLKDGAR